MNIKNLGKEDLVIDVYKVYTMFLDSVECQIWQDNIDPKIAIYRSFRAHPKNNTLQWLENKSATFEEALKIILMNLSVPKETRENIKYKIR